MKDYKTDLTPASYIEKFYPGKLFFGVVCLMSVFVLLIPTACNNSNIGPEVKVPAPAHRVTWDGYSLFIDGKRLVIWSGEFHYWRLPSPQLWRDVLEKMKAAGFNTVSIYFDWAYHSPKPGVYDFSGIRDVNQLLTMTEQVGLYVIARPGPYIEERMTWLSRYGVLMRREVVWGR